jgi:hypothetical protein
MIPMKNFLFILIAFLFCSFNDKGSHWYNSTFYRCKYQTKQGRFNGNYTSFYNNGKKKAQGLFSNNYHSGIWSVWDENGKLILQRNYVNPFEFTGLFPEKTKSHKSNYKLERDFTGCYKHLDFTPDMILFASRNWRKIEPTFNPLLFDNNRLYTVLQNLVLTKQVNAYENDSLKRTKNPDQIKNGELSIVGFKTMGDAFLDNDRLTMEYYTIGICPLAVYKNTSDTVDLYWLQMDDLRTALAKEKLNSKDLPSTIKSLDDLFFFHCFQSSVYKSLSFAKDNTHPLQKADPINQALRVDLDIIDNEHDLWVYFLDKTK